MDAQPVYLESEITQRSVTRHFAHDPKEVARARRLVRTELEAWDLVADMPALELAVSELVTNAIVHGRGQVEVHMQDLDGCVRLEVRNEGTVGASRPTVRNDAANGGWGLRLVEGLSDTWGTWCDDGSTHVWMERRTQRRGNDVDGGGQI